MSVETEVTRVLSNPDHVILSDALKSRLGEDPDKTQNSYNVLAVIKSLKFNTEADLLSLDINKTRSIIVLSIPSFKIMDAAFSLKQESVEIEFENCESKIAGTVTSVLVEKETERNIGNFNLTLCVD